MSLDQVLRNHNSRTAQQVELSFEAGPGLQSVGEHSENRALWRFDFFDPYAALQGFGFTDDHWHRCKEMRVPQVIEVGANVSGQDALKFAILRVESHEANHTAACARDAAVD